MKSDDFKVVAESLRKTGKVTSFTKGCSMRPMLRHHKDLVVIEQINRPLKKGDVVLYPAQNNVKYLLHRIIRIKNGRYIIRGDNNYFTEKNVDTESIIGILKEFYRDGKYINCETDTKYKLYTFYILHSYPLRFVYKKAEPYIRTPVGKILRKLGLRRNR